MKVGLVVPHIFMQRDILPRVIFSPAELAIGLADGLTSSGHDVTLFSPGPVATNARNETADLSLFEAELAARGDNYLDLLKKHPLTFISLARQVQAELIAKAFQLANQDKLDVVHIYTNEEDIALPFIEFCHKPVVLTHHDPFNFLVRYRSNFPKYTHLNWLSVSLAQRQTMPKSTNWVGNIYHGLSPDRFTFQANPARQYIAYIGRIIEPKGVHLAVEAIKYYNSAHQHRLSLKIAGKHYASGQKDNYWQAKVAPLIDGQEIEYVGFIKGDQDKQSFLGQAEALIMPSTFEEPFGLVMIEALACGTPVIGLNSGAIPEVINHTKTGFVVTKQASEAATANKLSQAIADIPKIDRLKCRQEFEDRFSLSRMCAEHAAAYKRLIDSTK